MLTCKRLKESEVWFLYPREEPVFVTPGGSSFLIGASAAESKANLKIDFFLSAPADFKSGDPSHCLGPRRDFLHSTDSHS